MGLTGIDFTRQQQRECAAYIEAGGPDQRGATLGMFDWFAEEFIMERETWPKQNDSDSRQECSVLVDAAPR
jgi:hypothetical protein